MEIRRAAVKDLAEILAIYQLAREEMRRFGNPCQWGESYPPPELVEQDIAEGNTYVITDGSEIAAVFVLTGMIYLFRRAGKMLGGRKAGREAEREPAEERSMEGQTKLPLRDPSIFRTAPMPVLEEEEPGRFPERKRRQR